MKVTSTDLLEFNPQEEIRERKNDSARLYIFTIHTSRLSLFSNVVFTHRFTT